MNPTATQQKAPPADPSALDLARIRADFPILDRKVHGKPLVYFDNAATTQKPRAVIEALDRYYRQSNANVHRGVHTLSQEATDLYEDARKRIAQFLGSPVICEVIFTSGTTDSINLVAQTYGRKHLRPGDEILISTMEHHSNIVPWQMLCEEKGARIRVIPINDHGEILLDEYERMLHPRVRLVSIVHVSNALGTINPIRKITDMAHAHGIPVLLDGAQSVPHMPINLADLGVDFFACSGHKMYGPTGIGILWGRGKYLEAVPPYKGGGDMILSVSFEKTVYNHLPYKFEAGTPNIADAIALGAAVDYLQSIGMQNIAAHENDLLQYATNALQQVPGLRIIGTAPQKAGVISFVMESAHPHDIGQLLDDHGIAIRAGHHCAQPLMQRFGLPATARISLALYNTRHEIDAAVNALHEVNRIFN
jgi:cysteine desulfurase/selenocysteine lyase